MCMFSLNILLYFPLLVENLNFALFVFLHFPIKIFILLVVKTKRVRVNCSECKVCRLTFVWGSVFSQGFTYPVRTHFLENILEMTGYRLTPHNQIDDYGQEKVWKMQKQAQSLRKRKSQIASSVEVSIKYPL